MEQKEEDREERLQREDILEQADFTSERTYGARVAQR